MFLNLRYLPIKRDAWAQSLSRVLLSTTPWDFLGKNTRAGCHFLLQETLLNQGLNLNLLCLLHWQAGSLPLSHLGIYMFIYIAKWPQVVSVQFHSVTQWSPTLCDPMDWSMPGLPVYHLLPSLPKLMSIELVVPSNHLILCRPLLLLPSIFPSIRVFSNESVLCIRWPKYQSFSFNISPSNDTQDWSLLGWTGWISRGLSKVFSNTTVQKHQFFCAQLSL